jgi:YHS domain-containing protein
MRAAAAILVLAALLLPGCTTMHVVSDGGDSNLMLRGYDPVAYFIEGRPMPGRPEIKATHGGVTYRFASESNRQLFITQPARYVPQYGGFCAQRMSFAIPAAAEPAVFKIIAGRLYVFGGARQRLYFEMDQERNLRLADQYWESEVRDSIWQIQAFKRGWIARVPHYRTEEILAEEYARRSGK